jgi:hypothetical protein
MVTLERPIIILGSARSGTTLLAQLLKEHPTLAVWEEPTHIWRHRHAYRSSDILTARDATPAISAYIRRQFESYLRASHKERFVEKTPSNCFRVPFIREVFPDALFVHLVRDGRAVTVSAMVQWQHGLIMDRTETGERHVATNSSFTAAGDLWQRSKGMSAALRTTAKFLRDTRRLTGGLWTLLEAPAYVPGLLRIFLRKLTRDRSFIWGPRFPGIREIHRRYTLLEACALQWASSVQAVSAHTHDLPAGQYAELRYEDLIADPVWFLERFCAFTGIPAPEAFLASAAKSVRPQGGGSWQDRLSPEEAHLLESWLAPQLLYYGYHTGRHEARGTETGVIAHSTAIAG